MRLARECSPFRAGHPTEGQPCRTLQSRSGATKTKDNDRLSANDDAVLSSSSASVSVPPSCRFRRQRIYAQPSNSKKEPRIYYYTETFSRFMYRFRHRACPSKSLNNRRCTDGQSLRKEQAQVHFELKMIWPHESSIGRCYP